MSGPSELYEVLEKEYEELHGTLPYKTDGLDREARLKAICEAVHKLEKKRTALCFSGGGIRSATFGLGVLQGLARKGLLTEFDYLSTVSGGGYLGGWFSAWLKHESDTQQGDAEAALDKIQCDIQYDPPKPILQPEPEPVRHLRSYSNYMSPRLGLLSADTWTLVAIYFRNLLLNWLVLVPLIIGALAVPRISLAVARWESPGRPSEALIVIAFWLAVATGIFAVAFIIANRPSLADAPPLKESLSRLELKRRDEWRFLKLCLAPLLLLASLITTYWAWLRVPADRLDYGLTLFGTHLHNAFVFALFGITLYGGGYLFAQAVLLKRLLLREIPFALTTGGLGGILTYLVATNVGFFYDPTRVPQTTDAAMGAASAVLYTALYTTLAAPTFLLLFLIAATIFVGFASRWTNDADREWLARAGAWVLIAAAAWVAASAVVFFGPLLLFYVGEKIVTAIGTAAGVITVGGGASGVTAATGKEEAREGAGSSWKPVLKKAVIALAAPIFAVFILMVLSLLTSYLYLAIYNALVDAGSWADGVRWALGVYKIDWGYYSPHAADGTPLILYDKYGLLNIIYYLPGRFVFALTFVIVGVGVGMGFRVNINKFSLHAAYRDRLIRAYLGASRKKSGRHPNPFTGFDEGDNIAMSKLAKRPLHVVNMTLNLVSVASDQLAWQDRKAESFTASRLFCGSFCIPRGYRGSERYGYDKASKRGISLGTAVAVSGAAASPNMGYYSSTFVTFLLSFFNVRLGWWLGNPGEAGKDTWDKSGPMFGPSALVAETLGWTDDQHPYVYLSDGGHFENLGLYEMVLRRCHTIVVSDGSADPSLTFNDLGNAVSKIRDDLGITIEFDDIPITPKDREKIAYARPEKRDEKYCAVGRILYAGKDGAGAPEGTLIYIKPNIYGGEPADVFNYAKSNPAFPHESTGDQMYSESQFESYRALGSYVVETICEGGDVKDLASFVREAQNYLTKQAAQTPAHGNGAGTTAVHEVEPKQ